MIKILNGGFQTLIEEWIGRVGYMDIGIANSGTMDHFAARAANLLVKNPLNEAVIEIICGSFNAEFEEDATIAITGADFKPMLNGKPIRLWEAISVKKGDIIESGCMSQDSVGFRQYWAISGGIDIPLYLGSKSTAIYGGFGGYKGRALKKGDELKLINSTKNIESLSGRKLNPKIVPEYKTDWVMRAIPGPCSAPDYFTVEGMEQFFTAKYKSQTVAERSGIRLDGPKPIWSEVRLTGGGHPSNVIDNGYPGPGCLDISGDVPILFPRECPTSGGYACALSVVYADQWIMGQIIPGKDTVKFEYSTIEEAVELRKKQNELLTESYIIK